MSNFKVGDVVYTIRYVYDNPVRRTVITGEATKIGKNEIYMARSDGDPIDIPRYKKDIYLSREEAEFVVKARALEEV